MHGESVIVAAEPPLVGDRGSFEHFYRSEYRRVLGLAYGLCGDRGLAEEVTQEAFLAAFKSWEGLDNPAGWVRSVVANRSRSWLRRRYAEMRALVRLGAEADPSIREMPADSAHFWWQVRRLPRRQAQAIALVYLNGLAVRQVAEILGCAESTVRVHLTRGRRALAEAFGTEEER
jgi:RNA polymerase sigma-70 factor (ECF subfamily)